MARVYNWQIGREMSYWYPESRPKRQFAAVFDTNKCIACQTCTLACKTTWTNFQIPFAASLHTASAMSTACNTSSCFPIPKPRFDRSVSLQSWRK